MTERIPCLTLVKKPLETYFCIREADGDRELNDEECRILLELAAASPPGRPDREDGVDEILKNYRHFISARPELISLLYDIDMLPEQCRTEVGAIRLAGLCEVWKKYEASAEENKNLHAARGMEMLSQMAVETKATKAEKDRVVKFLRDYRDRDIFAYTGSIRKIAEAFADAIEIDKHRKDGG